MCGNGGQNTCAGIGMLVNVIHNNTGKINDQAFWPKGAMIR
jgi:hypothetical protein